MSTPYLKRLFALLFILYSSCQFSSPTFLWEPLISRLVNYSDTTTFYLFTLGKPMPVVVDTFPDFLFLRDSIGSWLQFHLEGVQCEVYCFPIRNPVSEKNPLHGITVKFLFSSYKEAITGYQRCMEILWERMQKAPDGHFGHHYWILENQIVHLYLFDLRPMIVISYAIR